MEGNIKLSPTKPSKPPSQNAMLVSSKQRGNPVLKSISNVAWEYAEIEPDYILGRTTCALFLSLRYHNINPEYIYNRIQKLARNFELRVLLVQVDIQDPSHALKSLSKVCIIHNMTMVLAWSNEEAGRYLECYKAFENKSPDSIREPQKLSNDQLGQVTDCLTTVRAINRTDAASLMSVFGTVKEVCNVEKDELSLCPGMGPQKAKQLHEILHASFVSNDKLAV